MQKKTPIKQKSSLEDSLRLNLKPQALVMTPCRACNGTGRCFTNDIGARGIEYLYRDNCLICHGKGFVNG